jgi:hypothetical protein
MYASIFRQSAPSLHPFALVCKVKIRGTFGGWGLAPSPILVKQLSKL